MLAEAISVGTSIGGLTVCPGFLHSSEHGSWVLRVSFSRDKKSNGSCITFSNPVIEVTQQICHILFTRNRLLSKAIMYLMGKIFIVEVSEDL